MISLSSSEASLIGEHKQKLWATSGEASVHRRSQTQKEWLPEMAATLFVLSVFLV